MAGLPYHHHHILLPTPFLGPPQVSTPPCAQQEIGELPNMGRGVPLEALDPALKKAHLNWFPKSSNPAAAQSFGIWTGNKNRNEVLIPKHEQPKAWRGSYQRWVRRYLTFPYLSHLSTVIGHSLSTGK